MVYITSWQQFQEAAEALYEKSPDNTRYVVKFRSSEGKLVLKITDDTTCLKFKTYSSIFLNRFEQLNYTLIQKMQNRKRKPAPPIPITPAAAVASFPVQSTPESHNAGSEGGAVGSSGVAGGGAAKKKAKKKKK
ncbi:signal recognition particle, SRP9/SRP14 subunit [Abortiporus biennis]|nr:signal recognition particle, SRP9/SRP14 subunit [Abortiporus biennis]